MQVTNIQGQRFGKLLIQERAGSTNRGMALWKAICDCGKEGIFSGGALRAGKTRSCGCNAAYTKKPFEPLYKTRFYQIWVDMRQRCYNPNSRDFSAYGGRGIKVCIRWFSFIHFKEDMLPTYREHLTIDRINVNGNYEPSNCRWATWEEQAKNKR